MDQTALLSLQTHLHEGFGGFSQINGPSDLLCRSITYWMPLIKKCNNIFEITMIYSRLQVSCMEVPRYLNLNWIVCTLNCFNVHCGCILVKYCLLAAKSLAEKSILQHLINIFLDGSFTRRFLYPNLFVGSAVQRCNPLIRIDVRSRYVRRVYLTFYGLNRSNSILFYQRKKIPNNLQIAIEIFRSVDKCLLISYLFVRVSS